MTLGQKEHLSNPHVTTWVHEAVELCKPDNVFWCDGSDEERVYLENRAVQEKVLLPLDPQKRPGSFYHRSHPNDVARTENLTFICTQDSTEAGPTNNWLAPAEAYARCRTIAKDSMRGRTMYVIPFVMGPFDSPYSKVGIQITDSIYVVLNMRIMTRMGKKAIDELGNSDAFTKCFHAMCDMDIEKRMICHFPEDNVIWSVSSAYGGNALLGKKCLALRIGSYLGMKEGWLAEHMLILGLKSPQGRLHYICAAFPSQCGKTNLAMMVPPSIFKDYKVYTVGDDIAWLRIGSDGRLWAVNPENGFFGVAPGTSMKTNPIAMQTISKNTIFTNVALTQDQDVWWEGLGNPPANLIDWKGNPWNPTSGEKAAHPNSRFTAPLSQCPEISSHIEDPQGVPISAIIFGGRRAKVAPLVYETFNWQHGTYTGATVASETTAAATGKVGVVRRDPMAMRPFIGYHVGDYLNHWLEMGKRIPQPPKIFHVNWFRTDENGQYLWPGYSENMRVMEWILKRCDNTVGAHATPIGNVPYQDELNLEGLKNFPLQNMKELLKVDKLEWLPELDTQLDFFKELKDRIPQALLQEHTTQKSRLLAA